MSDSNSNKEYTIKQAAEILDISTSTVRRRINNNEIDAYKKETEYGPTYFIPASEIDAAVMEKEVVNVSKPVEIENLKETLLEAFNQQNKALINEVMDRVENKLEEQNETLEDYNEQINKQSEKLNEQKELIKEQKNSIEKLSSQIEELKEKQEQSLLNKIKNLFQ